MRPVLPCTTQAPLQYLPMSKHALPYISAAAPVLQEATTPSMAQPQAGWGYPPVRKLMPRRGHHDSVCNRSTSKRPVIQLWAASHRQALGQCRNGCTQRPRTRLVSYFPLWVSPAFPWCMLAVFAYIMGNAAFCTIHAKCPCLQQSMKLTAHSIDSLAYFILLSCI